MLRFTSHQVLGSRLEVRAASGKLAPNAYNLPPTATPYQNLDSSQSDYRLFRSGFGTGQAGRSV